MPKLSKGTLCVASPVDFAEACFSVPAIRALKQLRPTDPLHVICPESLRKLWETIPELDEVLAYPDHLPARKIVREMSEPLQACASALLWEAGDVAKAFAKLKVPQRVGYPAPGLEKFLTDPVTLVLEPAPIEHRVRYYLNLVQELGADAFVPQNFNTIPLHSVVQEPCNSEARYRIAWTSESEYGEAYQWKDDLFEQVKTRVEKAIPHKIEWVQCHPRTVARDEEILKKLSGCVALLACDGEVAHWAAHFGMPAVVLFGPGEPAWKRPLGKQNRVVREHVACSPCYLEKCPLDRRCQSEISAESVADLLIEVVLADS